MRWTAAGKTARLRLSWVHEEADERAGPSSTLKRWDVCPLGLVSRLDVRHKQEFERGAKKLVNVINKTVKVGKILSVKFCNFDCK